MPYKLTGTIIGNYAVGFKIAAHKMRQDNTLDISVENGLLGTTEVESGATTYTIITATDEDAFVTFVPQIGRMWHRGIFNYVGEYVYPTDVVANPFYFICVGAGYSANEEPIFNNNKLVYSKDGNAIFEVVEAIPPAHIAYPHKPTYYEE
ncbi:MAG: hypothetical protein COA83_09745 [Methylophaga sp.]|nr:MAG: hypothetical protein COA83_09745 [Methylophaga sp.]